MFGWWKKDDGFEWREYVRTTILLKRKQRRDRVFAARDGAVAGAKRAGQAGVAAGGKGASAVGSSLIRASQVLGRWLMAILAFLWGAPRRLGARLAPALGKLQWHAKPLARRIAAPPVRGGLRLVCFTAVVVALAWLPGRGLSTETWIAFSIAVVAAGVLVAARVIIGERLLPPAFSERMPALGRLADRIPSISPAVVGGVVAAVLLALGSGLALQSWRAGHIGVPTFASLQKIPGITQIPGLSPARTIEGRASAIDGDTLRLGRQIVQLAGIEAPDRGQRCNRPGNRNWRCGETAREALSRLIARQRVTCTVSGGEGERVVSGRCEAAGRDLAEALVSKGHVFAQSGLFARYGAAEVAARDAKAGLWRGSPERPQVWRDKLWEEAKRTAPDGCPIKGQVSSDGKIYLLPWSPRYGRVNVRSGRGERWFCSEDEAREAGWRAPERS